MSSNQTEEIDMPKRDLKIVSDVTGVPQPMPAAEAAVAPDQFNDETAEWAELLRELTELADADTQLDLFSVADFRSLVEADTAAVAPAASAPGAPTTSDDGDTA